MQMVVKCCELRKSFTCRCQNHLPDGWGDRLNCVQSALSSRAKRHNGRKTRRCVRGSQVVNLQGLLVWHVIGFILLDDLRIFQFKNVGWWLRILICIQLFHKCFEDLVSHLPCWWCVGGSSDTPRLKQFWRIDHLEGTNELCIQWFI